MTNAGKLDPRDVCREKQADAANLALEARKIAAARQAVAEGRVLEGEPALAWLRAWAASAAPPVGDPPQRD
jgi:hypothetical protein